MSIIKILTNFFVLLLVFPYSAFSKEVTSFEEDIRLSVTGNTTCSLVSNRVTNGTKSLQMEIEEFSFFFKHSICSFNLTKEKSKNIDRNSHLLFDIYNESSNETKHKITFYDRDNKRWLVPFSLKPGMWNTVRIPLWRSKGLIDIRDIKKINIITTKARHKNTLYVDNFRVSQLSIKDTSAFEVDVISPASKNTFYISGNEKRTVKLRLQLNARLSSHKNKNYVVTLLDKNNKEFGHKKIEYTDLKPENHIVFKDVALSLNQIYSIHVELFNIENKLITEKSIEIKTLPREQGLVTTNLNGYVEINNKPFFPVGMFNTPGDELPEVAKAGFNSVHSYTPVSAEYLKYAAENNIYVLSNIKKKYNKKTKFYHTFPDDNQALSKYIDVIKNSSHLLGYYYFDEPSPTGSDNIEMSKLSNYISSLDPYHLNLGTTNRFQEFYHSASDVLMINDYPIPGRLNKLIDKFQLINSRQTKNKTVFFLAQAFNKETHFMHSLFPTKYGRLRPPTFDESRTMSWLAISQGAKGIFFYSYHTQGFYFSNAFPWAWYGLSQHAKELQTLSPWITSGHYNAGNAVNSNNLIVTKKVYKDNFLYIVSNISNKPVTDEISLKCKKKSHNKIFVVSEDRTISHEDCVFNDTFEPFETHLYTSDRVLGNNNDLESITEIRKQVAIKQQQHNAENPSLFTYRDGARLHASWEFPEPELVNRKVFYRMIDGYPGTQWVIGNKYSKANIPGWESKDFTSAGRWIEVRSPVEKLINRIKVITSDDLEFEIRVLKNDKWVSLKHQVIEDKQYHHKYTTKTSIAKFSPQPIDRFRIILPEKSKQHTEVVFELSAWLEN